MNSTGKSLTNTDLLRNYLLMALSHTVQEKLYKKYWAKIQNNVGAKMMEQYMVHYLIMKRKSDSINLHHRSSKINKNNLYDSYKLYFTPEQKNDNGTEKLLSDMFRYSNVYRKIVNNDNISSDLDKAIYELIYELNADQAAIFLLYLLDYQDQHGISDADMLEAVKAIISYVFRLKMFKGSVSSQFFALTIQYFDRCDEATSFIDKVWIALTSGQGSYRFPRDREFQSAFETKDMYLEFKPPLIRYILYKFERSRTKEVVEQDNTTIDHILPQDTKLWRDHLASISDNAYQDCIHKIGNLTLTKLNSEMSNNPFEQKKQVYKVSNYSITRDLADYSDWSSNEIKARCVSMAEEAVKIWALPDIYNKETDTDIFFNMEDDIELLFGNLKEMITSFDESIVEVQNKHYINYKRGKSNLISVVPHQNYLGVTLVARKEDLFPNDNLEDISGKGHLGNGDTLMRIHNDDDIWQLLEYLEQIKPEEPDAPEDVMKASLQKIQQHTGKELKKITKRAYKTTNNEEGFVFFTSKPYNSQGNRRKFWYGYRRKLLEKIEGCENKYIVLGCGETGDVLMIPVEAMESLVDNLSCTLDKNGEPDYWHIVIFKDQEARFMQKLSKPAVQEIDITKYVI